MAKHIVKQGECIESISFEHGLFWDTLWNLPENAELKQKRKDPNILFPGDEVFVPDKEEKTESCATEQKHRFRKKGVPAELRIRFMKTIEDEKCESPPEEDTISLHATLEEYRPEVKITSKPRPNISCIIEIDGITKEGKTDSEGLLKFSIPPNAQSGKITLCEEDEKFVHPLKIGHLNPISSLSGVKERLHNLGYICEEESEEKTDQLKDAIIVFQQNQGLTISGEIDQPTIDKLKEVHGS